MARSSAGRWISIKSRAISGCARNCRNAASCGVGVLFFFFIGIGTYNPGWRWSLHAGAMTGKPSERHIGYIISGEMMVRDSDGNENLVHAGEAFEVAENHDAWVVGDTPCVALDFIHLPR